MRISIGLVITACLFACFLEFSLIGYAPRRQPLYVGTLTNFLDVGTTRLAEDAQTLDVVVVTGRQEGLGDKRDKKTSSVAENIGQSDGTVLQVMQDLPGVAVQEGKVLFARQRPRGGADGRQADGHHGLRRPTSTSAASPVACSILASTTPSTARTRSTFLPTSCPPLPGRIPSNYCRTRTWPTSRSTTCGPCATVGSRAVVKLRRRVLPTNMQFFPGQNTPTDFNAGGGATYRETIPAAYGNYVFENQKLEAEIGLRVECFKLRYEVDPNHPTNQSDGYGYTQPFPNVRLAYKFNDHNKLSVFYNRCVDRPNEVDIRIFPKYDDAEIIKVGNPALSAQFTDSFELGFRSSLAKGYFYAASCHRQADGTITRIASTVPGDVAPRNTLIYAIFQNAGRSYNTGVEAVFTHDFSKVLSFNLILHGYHNQIDAFTVLNKYPCRKHLLG